MAHENDEIPLDDINLDVKNEQDTLNENVLNETDINEEYYPTQDGGHHGLAWYPRQDVPDVEYAVMDSNQFCRKKIVSLVDEKLRKVENFHMLISDQYYNTLEREIYYTERSAVISDINMIQIHHGIMK